MFKNTFNSLLKNFLVFATALQLSCGVVPKYSYDRGEIKSTYEDLYYINRVDVIKKSDDEFTLELNFVYDTYLFTYQEVYSRYGSRSSFDRLFRDFDLVSPGNRPTKSLNFRIDSSGDADETILNGELSKYGVGYSFMISTTSEGKGIVNLRHDFQNFELDEASVTKVYANRFPFATFSRINFIPWNWEDDVKTNNLDYELLFNLGPYDDDFVYLSRDLEESENSIYQGRFEKYTDQMEKYIKLPITVKFVEKEDVYKLRKLEEARIAQAKLEEEEKRKKESERTKQEEEKKKKDKEEREKKEREERTRLDNIVQTNIRNNLVQLNVYVRDILSGKDIIGAEISIVSYAPNPQDVLHKKGFPLNRLNEFYIHSYPHSFNGQNWETNGDYCKITSRDYPCKFTVWKDAKHVVVVKHDNYIQYVEEKLIPTKHGLTQFFELPEKGVIVRGKAPEKGRRTGR